MTICFPCKTKKSTKNIDIILIHTVYVYKSCIYNDAILRHLTNEYVAKNLYVTVCKNQPSSHHKLKYLLVQLVATYVQ